MMEMDGNYDDGISYSGNQKSIPNKKITKLNEKNICMVCYQQISLVTYI